MGAAESRGRMMERRLLSREDAATYCGCAPGTFSRWVASGYMPPPLPGMRRWDRLAIDARISVLSGANDNDPQDDPYLAWKRADDARAS